MQGTVHILRHILRHNSRHQLRYIEIIQHSAFLNSSPLGVATDVYVKNPLVKDIGLNSYSNTGFRFLLIL